jgi:formate hydrogenlyase transcriptional activator
MPVTQTGTDDTGEKRDLEVLQAIVAGTSYATGQSFFESLVKNLALAIDVQFALVAEFDDANLLARPLAFWADGQFVANEPYALGGTPCEVVVNRGYCHHDHGVAEQYPLDKTLNSLGLQSYLGVPLLDPMGKTLGHLAVFDRRPMPEALRRLYMFRIFAARAAAEIDRIGTLKRLADSEARYHNLFDMAPIPYVFEDTETRFIDANQAAMKLLGLQPEEVRGTVGMSLVAQTPENLEQLNQAFEDIRQGRERSLLELELRRKDNGQPIWVQFWSRPDEKGEVTRTMIIDITARVLAERERERLSQENSYLREEIRSTHNFDEIAGASTALRTALEHVSAVANTDTTVLITGETGTGKELVARAIHATSMRHERPLIKVNCAALPATLVESELFGHEKGAFTGATARRAGKFELAHGGTIFLDEIGELPLDMQAKLLRVLQEKEFERVGGSEPLRVDVRVIAATNRDLAQAMAEKTFREDLYYRLCVFPVRIPPLRERQGDISVLAGKFVQQFSRQIGKEISGISKAALKRLESWHWPGNVRELRNIVERAVILARGPLLEIGEEILAVQRNTADSAPGSAESMARTDNEKPDSIPKTPSESGGLRDVERQHILDVLQKTGWRIEGEKGAARILGMNPNTLRSRMKKLDLKRPGN